MNHKAYQGNPDLKLSCIHGMKQLIEAKKLTQDRSWDVKAYASAVQTEATLAELIRALFIQLPEKEAYKWAIDHLEAIPVNADLSKVWFQFIDWLILDKHKGIKIHADQEGIRSIYEQLTAYIHQPSPALENQISQDCDAYLLNLNIDNDPTNKYLYLCTIAKSIVNRFPYQLIDHVQQFYQCLTLNPEEVRSKLLATNNGADVLSDFEPGEFERLFNEPIVPNESSQSDHQNTITISLAKKLKEFLNNAPVTI